MTKHKRQIYKEYLEVVNWLENQTIDKERQYMKSYRRSSFYLLRAKWLINHLNIDLTSFKIIHIAGTSGKGSTVAMVHSILQQAGEKVGSFYSPHPTTSIERIKVDNKFIPPKDFINFVNKLKPIIYKMSQSCDYGTVSYFEIFFAIALLYFQKTKCKYIILETGCGGEFDATNIIEQPIICAITNIGLDHTQLLGSSLEKIAKTKAGIIKNHSQFLTTESRLQLIKIFKNICKKRKCTWVNIKKIKPINLAMVGKEQQKNALLAINITKTIGLKKKDILAGIKQVKLPCRFELIQTRPKVILDGAHNYDKLKSILENLKLFNFNRLFLIITINKNKDIERIVKLLNKSNLLKKAEIYITRHLEQAKTCINPQTMYNLFSSRLKMQSQTIDNPDQALDIALKEASFKDLIVVTGSFYLAGYLRKKWISEEQILDRLQ